MTAPPRTDPRTLLGLAALLLILFRPWAFGDEPLFGSDLILFFYPVLTAVRDALASGHFPWWTERVFAGMPLAADPQASVFYPPAWLLFTGPFERTMGAYLAAHLLLLGAGASVAFSRLGAGRLGAFLGGAAVMLGTTVPGRLAAGHLTYLQSAAWIPWAYSSLLGYLAAGDRRRLAAVGAFVSLSLLGGFPQIAFYGILWLLWTSVSAPRRMGPGVVRTAVETAGAAALGFGIAAAMLVPGWEMSRLSVRTAGMSDAFSLSDSLPFRHLATFFLPGLFGMDAATYTGGEPNQWWEFTAFNGLLPWLALGMLGTSLWRRSAFAHAAAPIPFTILLALGGNTPLFPLVMRLPGFSLFRIPAQIVFLTAMALGAVTSLAVTSLADAPPRMRIALLPAAAGAAFGAAWLAAPGGESWSSALLIAALTCMAFALGAMLIIVGRRRTGITLIGCVAVAELLLPALPTVEHAPLDRFFPSGQIAQGVRPLGEPYRILALRPSAPTAPAPAANGPLRVGGEWITGYNPLLPAGTARLLTAMKGRPWPSAAIHYPPPEIADSPVIDLLNCRVIVDSGEGPPPSPAVSRLPWQSRDPRWRFWLNDRALGRATVYPSVTRVPDHALDRRIRSLDPAAELIVDDRLALPPAGGAGPVRPARYERHDPAFATVFDDSGAGGYLLVSQSWHPGWTASWERGNLPVLPGDIGLTLVPLPEGCRRVELRYRPASHRAGLAVSVASLLVLGLALRRRRISPP